MENRKKAYILTSMVILLWGGSASAFKLALAQLTPNLLLFFSILISTIVLLVFLLVRQGWTFLKKLNGKTVQRAALAGFLNPFLYYIILFKAYDLLPGQIAMSLNYSWPIVLSILSVPILKHTLSVKQIISIFVSFIGAVMIASRGESNVFADISITGLIFVMSSTLVWAVFWLINTKDNKRDPIIKLFISFCFALFYSLIYTFLLEDIFYPPIETLWPLLYIAFFEMGITFILWLTALKLSDNTARLSNLIFITPFISLLFLNIIIGEQIYISTFLGLLLIVGSILAGLKK